MPVRYIGYMDLYTWMSTGEINERRVRKGDRISGTCFCVEIYGRASFSSQFIFYLVSKVTFV